MVHSVYSFNEKEARKFHTSIYVGKPNEKIIAGFTETVHNITSRTNNIGKHIKYDKLTKIHKSYKPSVYKLKCIEFYIGTIFRNLKIRQSEIFKSFLIKN